MNHSRRMRRLGITLLVIGLPILLIGATAFNLVLSMTPIPAPLDPTQPSNPWIGPALAGCAVVALLSLTAGPLAMTVGVLMLSTDGLQRRATLQPPQHHPAITLEQPHE